jgi:hypothetical protein
MFETIEWWMCGCFIGNIVVGQAPLSAPLVKLIETLELGRGDVYKAY